MAVTKGRCLTYVERKHQGHQEIKGALTAGAGRQAERGAADCFQVGAGRFTQLKTRSPRLWFTNLRHMGA